MDHVPQSFQALLPSSPVSQLELRRDKNYIIESLLKNATLEAWRWMVKTYDQKDITQVVKESRHLTPRDVRLWSYYFHIPTEQITCLQTDSPKTPTTSWPY